MARLGGVGEPKGGDTVLHHVGEAEEAVFGGADIAEVLDCGAFGFDAVNLLDSAVVALWVIEFLATVGLLAESEGGISDVGA